MSARAYHEERYGSVYLYSLTVDLETAAVKKGRSASIPSGLFQSGSLLSPLDEAALDRESAQVAQAAECF